MNSPRAENLQEFSDELTEFFSVSEEDTKEQDAFPSEVENLAMDEDTERISDQSCPSNQSPAGLHYFGRFINGVPLRTGLVAVRCKFCNIPEEEEYQHGPSDCTV